MRKRLYSFGVRGNAPARYRGIAARLRRTLQAGALGPGDRLVSARQLALRESVSLPTAVAALRVLEAEGLIIARPRSGYFVSGIAPRTPARSQPPSRARVVDLATLIRSIYEPERPVSAPLGAALPDPAWLPDRALRRALLEGAQRAGAEALAYSRPPGRADLRRQLARLASAWGGGFGPDEVVVTSGSTQALRLALRATCRPGDAVAVESPSYFGSLLLLESLGLKAVELPTDPQRGLDVRALAARLGSGPPIAAVLACPTAQNPLGASMSQNAKRELVQLLDQARVPLIEDDVYGDLAQGDPRPGACKACDETGNVLYCSSVSKVLAPGWRIGWIAAGRHHERVLQLRWEESLAGNPMIEAGLAAFIASGEYHRHVRRLRPRLAASLRAISARVEAAFPQGTRLSRPQAGFLLWVELPPEVDALAVHQHALAEGISVVPGHVFSPGLHYRHHLRLNCAREVTPALLAAVDRLGALCHQLLGAPALRRAGAAP
jgi:DNA-binding transcriptional MocR family regulator